MQSIRKQSARLLTRLLIILLSINLDIMAQTTHHGGGDGDSSSGADGKRYVNLYIDAYQCPSDDWARFSLSDGQDWTPDVESDNCTQGNEAGTGMFKLKRGETYTLRAIPKKAVNPPDGNVSLGWHIWSEDSSVIITGTASTSVYQNPMQEEEYTISIPKGTIFLTFDDGPLYGTDDVLRILKEEGIKGTFFMVGVHITSWGEQYVRDAYNNFEVGNHSFSHPWKPEDVIPYYSGPPTVVLEDFQKNDVTLSSTVNSSGQQFILARMPTKNTWRIPDIPPITDGSGGPAADLLQSNGYKVYGWDKEWHRSGIHPKESPEDMVEIINSALENNITKKEDKIIILMHDDMFRQSEEDDAKLLQFIQLLKEEGYQFDNISSY